MDNFTQTKWRKKVDFASFLPTKNLRGKDAVLIIIIIILIIIIIIIIDNKANYEKILFTINFTIQSKHYLHYSFPW